MNRLRNQNVPGCSQTDFRAKCITEMQCEGREKCVLRKIEMLRYVWHGVLNDAEDMNGLCRRYAFVVLAGATSDTNGFAGDPRGRVRRQKDGHGGNIPRFA